jgi:hypothetical protein
LARAARRDAHTEHLDQLQVFIVRFELSKPIGDVRGLLDNVRLHAKQIMAGPQRSEA